MNEFIVWDKKKREWIHSPERPINILGETVIMGEILRRENDSFLRIEDLDEVQVCLSIGKTDTEGNKIYADCSIVEFVWKNQNTKAVIKWDDIQLTYDVEFKSGFRARYADVYQEMFGLKVIGTLQEDKHLLGEEQ